MTQSDQTTARVLTIASLKGGVGRTTLAINLAALLVQTDRRILLLDLGSLGRATASLGLKLVDESGNFRIFSHGTDLLAFQQPVKTIPGLHLWRGGAALNEIEARLWSQDDSKRDFVLEGALSEARQCFDLILIDSPADQGPLGRNALASADDILVPVAGNAFDCLTIERTFELMNAVRRVDTPPSNVHCVFIGESTGFNKSNLSTACQRRMNVFKSTIVSDTETCSAAAAQGKTLFDYAPHSRVTRSLIEVCRELITTIFGPATHL